MLQLFEVYILLSSVLDYSPQKCCKTKVTMKILSLLFFFAGQIKNKCLKSFTKPVQFQILKKKKIFLVQLCTRLAWSSGKAKQGFHQGPICFMQHLARIPPAASVIPCSNTRDMAPAHEARSLSHNITLTECEPFSWATSKKSNSLFLLLQFPSHHSTCKTLHPATLSLQMMIKAVTWKQKHWGKICTALNSPAK